MDGVIQDYGGTYFKGGVGNHHLANGIEALAVGAAVWQTGIEGVGGCFHNAAIFADSVGLIDSKRLKFSII